MCDINCVQKLQISDKTEMKSDTILLLRDLFTFYFFILIKNLILFFLIFFFIFTYANDPCNMNNCMQYLQMKITGVKKQFEN